MTALDDFDSVLDARDRREARLRARARRAEDAVARVLALCDQAGRVSTSERMTVRVADVRAAIAGTS